MTEPSTALSEERLEGNENANAQLGVWARSMTESSLDESAQPEEDIDEESDDTESDALKSPSLILNVQIMNTNLVLARFWSANRQCSEAFKLTVI